MSFQALYGATCAEDDCGMRIRVGEEVEYSVTGLVHVDCPNDPLGFELKPTETVCTECWMVQPCERSEESWM